jgi:hypothetical protein
MYFPDTNLTSIDALIQFEDFKYPHAYNLLNKCIVILLLHDINNILTFYSHRSKEGHLFQR